MELTNPPGRFVIRNHVSTGTHRERCPVFTSDPRGNVRAPTLEFLHVCGTMSKGDAQSVAAGVHTQESGGCRVVRADR